MVKPFFLSFFFFPGRKEMMLRGILDIRIKKNINTIKKHISRISSYDNFKIIFDDLHKNYNNSSVIVGVCRGIT